MATLSQLDINVRLQLSGQKYSEMMYKYIDSLRWGKKSSIIEQNKLYLLGVYIELLMNYRILSCGETDTNNCITETEAQSVCDKISKLTNLCFQPLGFNYTGSEKQGGVGKMKIECDFKVR